jgi:hypothetical protein
MNIPNYIKSVRTAEFLFKNLIEYIEIWEENLQIEFAKSLEKLFKTSQADLLLENFKKIFNPLIKFCMKIISTDDKAVN